MLLPAHDMRTATAAFKALAAFLCLATGATAQERADYCQGLGEASVAPSGEGYAVSLLNPLCQRGAWDDQLDVIVLEIDGLRIVVQLHSAEGRTPDEMVVIAPPGWLADPARLTVEEYDTGVVNLIPMGMS